MEEVTYEDWLKNPTPREMWVWDYSENNKKRLKVIYISKKDITYPVITLAHGDTDSNRYMHCAEIKKQRRMTRKELSRWLREKPTREYKFGTTVFCNYYYLETEAHVEVLDGTLIREADGEWREPLVEVGE